MVKLPILVFCVKIYEKIYCFYAEDINLLEYQINISTDNF
jgi:hypothetical protein